MDDERRAARGRVVAVAALAVVALGAVVAVTVGGRASQPRPATTSGAIPRPDLAAPTGTVGVTDARQTVLRDGAAYDPRSRTWRRLPASPLSARANAAVAWTGAGLFVWGGNTSGIDAAAVTDGAIYDPNSRTWHTVAPLDVRPTTTARAVWTGNRVVLFTVVPAVRPTTVEVHVYDPATDRWSAAPEIRVPQTEIISIAAVVTGDTLWFWASVQTLGGGGLTTGNDAYRYDPTDNAWGRSTVVPKDTIRNVREPLWAGTHLFLAPGEMACSCGGFAETDTFGTWVDLRTGSSVRMTRWSQDDTAAGYVWTGRALVGVATTTSAGAAAWNPATNTWTALTAPSRTDGDGDITVWTGSEVLRWGGAAGHSLGP